MAACRDAFPFRQTESPLRFRPAESRGDGARGAGRRETALDAKTVRTLLASPSTAEFRPIKEKATRQGMIACDILSATYLMAEVLEPRCPALTRPFMLISPLVRLAEDSGGRRRPLPTSESVVRAAWSSRPLGLALVGCRRRTERLVSVRSETGQVFTAGWDKFLGVAVGLFNFGSKFIPQRMKHPTPISNCSECWQLPDSIQPAKSSSPTGCRKGCAIC